MVGSAIWRNLESKGYHNLLGKSSQELDLRNQQNVKNYFKDEKPDYVFLAAAKVGGILANNTFRAEFIYDNLQIQNNIIHHSYLNDVKKLIFLGSSCIYPRECPQPIKEEYLLSGVLEKTNEPYAVAKISGIKMCENYYNQYKCNFISVMPTNLYGQGDNFDLENSHVIPALIKKIHEAKLAKSESVELWGTGRPRREFLYVDDMADACVHLFESIDANQLYSMGINHINVGSGVDLTIHELAIMIANTIGFKGKIIYDNSKPDGTPQKLLDVTLLNKLGWYYNLDLKTGLELTYNQYLKTL